LKLRKSRGGGVASKGPRKMFEIIAMLGRRSEEKDKNIWGIRGCLFGNFFRGRRGEKKEDGGHFGKVQEKRRKV